MKLELSNQELCIISKDICGNRPLFGMLRANEYLSSPHPLHDALAAKAKQRFEQDDRYESFAPLIQAVLSGIQYKELPKELQLLVSKIHEQAPEMKRYAPTEALLRRRHKIRKREQLQRFGHPALPKQTPTGRRSLPKRKRLSGVTG